MFLLQTVYDLRLPLVGVECVRVIPSPEMHKTVTREKRVTEVMQGVVFIVSIIAVE